MDNQIVTIDNGILTLHRIVPEKQVSISDLVRTMIALSGENYTCTPILPGSENSCRLFVENDKSIGFLIQCNPTVRTIRYVSKAGVDVQEYTHDSEYSGKGVAYMFNVSMPWIWVFCKLFKVDKKTYDWRRCFLFSTYDNIETLRDRVYVAPVPNQWGNTCLMCTGDIIREGKPTDKPSLLCKKFIYRLWDSYFNDDLTPSMPSSIKSGSLLHTLGKWEELSNSNPGMALSRDFGLAEPGTASNVEEFISMAMGGNFDDAR